MRARTDRGAAAVEFALIVPLLLVLVFGVISYGYMLSFRQSVSQAAAEGARAAAVAPATADRQAIAFAAIETVMGGTCNSAFLHCETGSTGCASCLEVTVTYDYEADPAMLTFPGSGMVVPDQLSYTSTVELSQ